MGHTLPDMCIAATPHLWPEEPGVGEPQPGEEDKARIEQCCMAGHHLSFCIIVPQACDEVRNVNVLIVHDQLRDS